MGTPHPIVPYIGWIGTNSNGSTSTGSDVSNRQGGGVYTPSTGNITHRNYYASVYAYGNIGFNVFDVTPTFNPGVYTPDTCFEILSIESTKWKVIHNNGATVRGHGIRVTDIPTGAGV